MRKFYFFFTLICLTGLWADSPQEIVSTFDSENQFSENVEIDPGLDFDPPQPDPVLLDPQPRHTLPDELVINLKEPTFANGILSTDQGGVISAPGIRIQGQHIIYINRVENGIHVQKILGEGNLMLEYGNRAFVGTKLEYDFITRTGTLQDGKTFADLWFIGGDKIELKEDGSFYIYNAFVTTSESQENSWEVRAKHVRVTRDLLLSAKNISFQFFKVPLLWLPSFRNNLKFFTDPPIRYKLYWDKGLGPRVTVRYRVLSWNDFALYARLDYRLKTGFGGALESEYYSPSGNTVFVTRSYGAYFKTFPDQNGKKHYRLQGLYHTQTDDGKSQINLTYDKLSDIQLIGIFRSDDFEINTRRRTRLLLSYETDHGYAQLSVQPRINNFQSIDQELPRLTTSFRPIELGSSGIISENYANAGYLDYVFASNIKNIFTSYGVPNSLRAIRVETKNSVYRPFTAGPFTFTPNAGIQGIFYNNGPGASTVGQFVFTYGATANLRYYRTFSNLKHVIEPYARYDGITEPRADLDNYYVFDINDGLFRLNQLRLGIKNTLYISPFSPTFTADLFSNAYFGNHTFSVTFPKYYLNLGINLSSTSLDAGIAWNEQERVWDFTNVRFGWTINEAIAFSIEFRHRSSYDWRKGNHDSFILDMARSIDSLLLSSLSDKRNTLLTRLFIQLAPKWKVQFQSRTGWARSSQAGYNQFKIDLFSLLTSSWQLKLSYERFPSDNRFTGGLSLIK